MKQPLGKAAFSLVEVAFALGVASFCLITMIALIPVGLTANQASVEQTNAAGLMSAIVADLRSTPQPASKADAGPFQSKRYGITIPRAYATTSSSVSFFLKEDGTLSGTVDANADPTQNPHFRVLINFYPPASIAALGTSSLAATRARILITWPALSDPLVASTPSKFTGSVETVVKLNRNWLDH